MSRILARAVVVLACLALIIPAVFAVAGVLPFKLYLVHTGSMDPTIPSGSAVIVQQGVYAVGQPITFQTPEGPVTHRLVERKSDGTLVTKGDANATVDPGTVSPFNVVGGVVASPPAVGQILTYLKNPIGLASVILAIVVLWLAFSTVGTLVESRQRSVR